MCGRCPSILANFMWSDHGKINVDVILKDETIWFTQKSMAEF